MKRLFGAIVIILTIGAVLILAKNIIAKQLISAGVKTITGLRVDMKEMEIGVFRTLISIDGLRIFNPAGFEDRLMADMPEVYVDYDLGAFLKGSVHLERLRLVLKEVTVVKNHRGELNLDSLKTIRSKKSAVGKSFGKKSKISNLQIDILELKIGRVLYKDYYNTDKPIIREFNVNINERYKNIKDPRKLANLIVFKALVNTSITNLTDFDLGILRDGLSDPIGVTSKIVEGTAGTALKAGEEVIDTAKEATKKAAETIKNILPLGK